MRHPHPREVGSLTALPPISGHVEPAYSAVLDAFRNNFAEHNEIGGAVCVSVHGKVVVDLVGGWRDVARTLTWEHDTIVNAFSVGKGLTSLVAAMLVDRGAITYDTVVSHVWPAFTGHGKDSLTFADLLGHRAGLPAVRRTLPAKSMYDWDLMCSELAVTEPWWKPGTAHGYHVNTFGFLCGEVMRRVTGQSVGGLFRTLLGDPLGADIHLGVPVSEHDRIAEFEWPPTALTEVDTAGFTEQQLLQYNTYNNPLGTSGGGTVNTVEWRTAEIPSTNTHASARGIERVYRELAAGGGQLLGPSTLSSALSETSNGPDVVLERNSRFARGFQIPLPERGFGPNPAAFGHFGAGGSVGFCDPSTGVAFGYVMNQMGPRWQNPRNRALMDAVFASL